MSFGRSPGLTVLRPRGTFALPILNGCAGGAQEPAACWGQPPPSAAPRSTPASTASSCWAACVQRSCATSPPHAAQVRALRHQDQFERLQARTCGLPRKTPKVTKDPACKRPPPATRLPAVGSTCLQRVLRHVGAVFVNLAGTADERLARMRPRVRAPRAARPSRCPRLPTAAQCSRRSSGPRRCCAPPSGRGVDAGALQPSTTSTIWDRVVEWNKMARAMANPRRRRRALRGRPSTSLAATYRVGRGAVLSPGRTIARAQTRATTLPPGGLRGRRLHGPELRVGGRWRRRGRGLDSEDADPSAARGKRPRASYRGRGRAAAAVRRRPRGQAQEARAPARPRPRRGRHRHRRGASALREEDDGERDVVVPHSHDATALARSGVRRRIVDDDDDGATGRDGCPRLVREPPRPPRTIAERRTNRPAG